MADAGKIIALAKAAVGADVDDLKRALNTLQPSATNSDVGKAIIVKTVADGKPTSYEYGEAGGGVDPQDIEDAVDAWLTENITNPNSPPLDRSLSSSSAAAPADMMGNIKGNWISEDYIEEESENLLGSFTDGKYATDPTHTSSLNGFSYATADITGYEYVILTSYTTPATVGYPFVFYHDNQSDSIGGIEDYETVGTKTYKLKVPDGATHVHVNINTSQKDSAICKGIAKTQKTLDWFKLQDKNIPQSVIENLAEDVSGNLDVKPVNIDGRKVQYGGEAPADLSIENGYYTMKDEGVAPGYASSLTHFEFSVKKGDIIRTYLGSDVDVIAQQLKNTYFIVVDANGKCTKAFDVSIDSNYIYTFRIPENGATCYVTRYGSNPSSSYAKLYEDEFALKWLKLESANFDPYTIPENSIIRDATNSYIHGESIEKPFDFNNKIITVFGDSIASGIANDGAGNISLGSNSWAGLFCTHVGATRVSMAVGGATIAYKANEQYDSVYAQVTSFTGQTDVIMIAGGTNDYNQNVDVGQYGDSTQYTTYGALKLICEHIKTNYPTTPVFFITPINVMKDISGIDRSLLNKYRNAIYEVATSYGYNVINGIDLVPVVGNTTWDNEFITYNDGTHPTTKGHAMYYKNLCMKLL